MDGFKLNPGIKDDDETYGIFNQDFQSVRDQQKLNDLKAVGAPKKLKLPFKNIRR